MDASSSSFAQFFQPADKHTDRLPAMTDQSSAQSVEGQGTGWEGGRPGGAQGDGPSRLEPSFQGLSLVDLTDAGTAALPSPPRQALADRSLSSTSGPRLAPPPVPFKKLSDSTPNRQALPPSQSRRLAAAQVSGRVRPTPPALQTTSLSTSPSRHLHMSPSAPNLRQAPATSSLLIPSHWGGETGPGGSKGSLGRNAKGLSLALGRDSPTTSSTSSSEHSQSPLPTPLFHRPPMLQPVGRGGTPHTSIPQTPSSSTFSQFSAQQTASSSSASSKGPSLMTLITTSEMRDPTDGPSSQYESRPYADGPVEIVPNLYIGCDENARDWKELTERLGIKRVLNVAKELIDVLEESPSNPQEPTPIPPQVPPPPSLLRPPDWPSPERGLRNTVSTPDLRDQPPAVSGGTINGLPITEKRVALPNGSWIDYLHLPWSHGQADLVSGGEDGQAGFIRAGKWARDGMGRGQGVLVHCQCGISRSATLVISIVMQLAAEGSMPDALGEVRGMHDAYEFVKDRSPWIGPNVSLIYQLLEWERWLAARLAEEDRAAGLDRRSSPRLGFASDSVESEEEWSLRRAELEAQEEAEQMDRAMIERLQRTRSGVSTSNSAPSSNSVPSSRSSSFSSTGPSLPSKGSWRVKRRLSRSSLASVTTFEEEDEETDDPSASASTSGSQRTRSWAEMGSSTPSRSPSSGMSNLFDPPVEEVSPPPDLQDVNGRRRERQRSSTMSFVPSLATLPSSPITSTTNMSTRAPLPTEGTPKPLAGRPRARTHNSSSSITSIPDVTTSTPSRTHSPGRSSATPSGAREPPSSSVAQLGNSDGSLSPATPTVDYDDVSSEAPTPVPAAVRRPFGSHQSAKQRKDAHRRSFSVELQPSPLRQPPPHVKGHRRPNYSVSHILDSPLKTSSSPRRTSLLPSPGSSQSTTATSDFHALATLARRS